MSEPSGAPDSSYPLRRSSDPAPGSTPASGTVGDAEQLLKALRSGAVAVDAIAPQLPLAAVFAWYAEGKMSEAEFFTVLAEQEIDEVQLSDVPLERISPTEEVRRQQLAIAGFNARIDALEVRAVLDEVAEGHLSAVLQAATPLADGIGLRMRFARPDDGAERAPPGAAAALVVTCRAYIGSPSLPQAVKCEAVFSGAAMPSEHYCRVTLPLPIFRAGRRRLSKTVRDIQTMKPVELPPEASELFHEKYMVGLEVMSKNPLPTGGLGSVVKGALGGLFGR
jgi:hypothetical protein